VTVTLITGATRGVGRETARRLVAAGHTVWLGARDGDAGERTVAEVGGRAVRLDVTDDDSVRLAVETVRDESGGLDVLVNNAGIAGDQRAPGEATIADLERVLATNVVGRRACSTRSPLCSTRATFRWS
jgi:NAD(P)-dependent dehydrogenase (short-subunit alcohol dehydrogenase family)